MKKQYSELSGIYGILNTQNNKIYIGSSYKLHSRWLRHINELKQNIHYNIYLQRSWNKHGPKIFKLVILEYTSVNPDILFEREQYWIDNTPPSLLYNIGSVSGGDNLTNNPNKEKIIKQIQKTLTEKISFMSVEEKQKKWARYKDKNPNWRGGKTFFTCPICNKTIRITKKPQTCSQCRDISGAKNPFYGKTHSKETKAKLAKANKGRLPSNSKSVTIDNITYKSYTEAAKAIGVSTGLISYRIKKGIYIVT